MTSFRVEEFPFRAGAIRERGGLDPRYRNWPVVYALSDERRVYVGESRNAVARLEQHLKSDERRALRVARVVLDDRFNKSACLDLESYLIRLFAGDGKYDVLNRNEGITDADYYGRADYQRTFDAIFEELRSRGLFDRAVREIENTDLFKLSPFKALTQDQAVAVDDIVSGLFDDLAAGVSSRVVVQGDPGTGKTVVGIFLMKLLSDIRDSDPREPVDTDTLLSEYFVEGYRELLRDFRIGLVVPQQSLRRSIANVFKRTPGLSRAQVLTPFQVGGSEQRWDLLIADEAHRLSQRAAQAAGPLNAQFRNHNVRLFGADDPKWTQLDWIDAQSDHQVYLVDGLQSVRPADIPGPRLEALVETARRNQRHYRLTSQMRVRAGQDYVGYVRGVLAGTVDRREDFSGYDLRFFDDFAAMRREIRGREGEVGLSRLVAGYAWRWVSRNDPEAYDIRIDGEQLRWNVEAVDWVSSPGSVDEMGSIHTIQGYDLNYAGVVIGPDLRFDPATGRTFFDRSHYYDARGAANNGILGITYSDDDILTFVRNIYGVLLTRGVLGTYVYVCDRALREHLRRFF